ncbi:transmembrane protein [Mycobacterium avium subsp. hominissuis TH135]|nr:transmembrane protein [Mycobacterium avium subsp. hominissuis TH135]
MHEPRGSVSAPPPGYPVGPPPAYGPQPQYGTQYGAQYPGQYGAHYGPPPTYPPPGYGPPPTYPPPGYPPAPAFGPPPGYGVLKPGIIPLRPLTLGDIFNGAVGYIRANPKATLGLTATVVIAMQIITKAAVLGPLAAYGRFTGDRSDELTAGVLGAWSVSVGAGVLVGWLGGMLLSGMLTVIVGRAVFGSSITIGETWTKIRGRLPALLGLALLEAVVVAAIAGLVVVVIAILAAIGNAAAAVVLGIPLVLTVIALLVYLYTVVLFAPVLIVLERLPVLDAITRSFRLVRRGFWRVLGIRALTFLVTAVVANAVAVPFSIVGQVFQISSSGTAFLISTAILSVGAAIGEIITAPFNAGVIVLLYTDRRMRAEAFDLVLQSGATQGSYAAASTDNLWLTRPR